MANPSTTGGTGAGTEVLRRAYTNAITVTTDTTLHTVGSNKLVTILSVVMTETSDTDTKIDLMVNDNFLICQAPVAGEQTYIFSDKVILDDGDALKFDQNDAANFDVWVSYIEQEFTAP
jgi:hypothetical protein